MLRRALLLACLLAPLAVRAQTASLTVTPKSTFGKAECVPANDAADPALSLSWTLVPSSTPTTTWTYDIRALPSGANCASDTSAPSLLNTGTINWASNTSSYPGSTGDTLHLSKILAAIGGSCSATSDQVVRLCVQLLNGSSIVASQSTDVTIQLAAPSAPGGVTVAPGDSALNVSWNAPSGTPTADRYRVAVSALSAACPVPPPATLTTDCVGSLVTQATTSGTSRRVGGLTNGTTYAVQVFAISVGGNESVASSPPVAGTPAVVLDFWDQYGGVEQGGCGGGPAGLVSLLAVAGLMATLRRRS